MNLTNRIGGLGLATFVAVAGLAALPDLASAQQQIRFTATAGMGGPGAGQVSKRSVEKYAELLGLSSEQKESALAIHEGYAAAYQEAQKARRSAIDDAQRASEDDHSVFMEKWPKIEKDFRDKSQKLEKGLFDDMKSLLSGPAQEGKWVRVERMRRREVGLRAGGVSGESVDLTDVVDGLRLSSEAMSPISTLLEDYEKELDTQLQARAKATSDSPTFEPGKPFDPEKMKKQMADAREAGLKVKEVNERSARKIEPLLPEDKRAAFRDAVRERSFPQVYRPSRTARGMDAALKLDDLTPAQRASVQDLKSQYRREATPLNDAWASAITASEGEGQSGVILGTDGGHVMLNMGDDPPALVDARKARRDLDDRINDKLKGILSESQQSKVAKASTPDEEEMGGGMMRSSVVIRNDR
jgi:hypothetical protein